MWLLINNLTTVEYCENKHAIGEDGQSKYDVGIIKNLKQVLGDDPFLWFVPVGRPASVGLNFPSNDASTSDETSDSHGNEHSEMQESDCGKEWWEWVDGKRQDVLSCCQCMHDTSLEAMLKFSAMCKGTGSASRPMHYSARSRSSRNSGADQSTSDTASLHSKDASTKTFNRDGHNHRRLAQAFL